MVAKSGRISLASIMLAMFFGQYALAQSLATDPLVQQELSPQHWEPEGQHFPSNFNNRGSIVERSGYTGITTTSSIRIGNFRIEQGIIDGKVDYTVDLDAHHPHTVHSPFDVGATASSSASVDTETRQVNINLNWTGTYNHPANGYDAPQGGGYPEPNPLGAVDYFSFDIKGTAQGQFLVSQQEIQSKDLPPELSVQHNYFGVKQTITPPQDLPKDIERRELIETLIYKNKATADRSYTSGSSDSYFSFALRNIAENSKDLNNTEIINLNMWKESVSVDDFALRKIEYGLGSAQNSAWSNSIGLNSSMPIGSVGSENDRIYRSSKQLKMPNTLIKYGMRNNVNMNQKFSLAHSGATYVNFSPNFNPAFEDRPIKVRTPSEGGLLYIAKRVALNYKDNVEVRAVMRGMCNIIAAHGKKCGGTMAPTSILIDPPSQEEFVKRWQGFGLTDQQLIRLHNKWYRISLSYDTEYKFSYGGSLNEENQQSEVNDELETLCESSISSKMSQDTTSATVMSFCMLSFNPDQYKFSVADTKKYLRYVKKLSKAGKWVFPPWRIAGYLYNSSALLTACAIDPKLCTTVIGENWQDIIIGANIVHQVEAPPDFWVDDPDADKEHKDYTAIKEGTPPDDFDPCEKIKFEIDREKEVIKRMNDWDNKWWPKQYIPKHKHAIKQRTNALKKLREKFKREKCAGNSG